MKVNVITKDLEDFRGLCVGASRSDAERLEEAPGRARRATRRRQHRAPQSQGEQPPNRRHPADPRLEGSRAPGYGPPGRLRVPGQALQVAVGGGPGDHRHPLERPRLLRPEESAGPAMKQPVVRKLRCAVYTRKSTEE